MQKNKEQMSYQGAETCRFGFEVRNEVKEPETMFLLRHVNLLFWFLKPQKKQDSKK